MNQRDTDFVHMIDGDIKPLRRDDHIYHRFCNHIDSDQARIRQHAAMHGTQRQASLSNEFIEMVAPDDVLSFQRPGIQHGVFRKLRLGQYRSDARLDLHRVTLAEAQRNVYRFIQDCLHHQIRCCQIIHGMGRNTQPQAMLKSHVNAWLCQLPEVIAFHTAPQTDGGFGAVYVLLRKSAAAKHQNREQFQRRK